MKVEEIPQALAYGGFDSHLEGAYNAGFVIGYEYVGQQVAALQKELEEAKREADLLGSACDKIRVSDSIEIYDLMQQLSALQKELEESQALASQITTDWIPANQKLAQERDKFKLVLQDIATDCETISSGSFGMKRLAGYANDALEGASWLDEFENVERIEALTKERDELRENRNMHLISKAQNEELRTECERLKEAKCEELEASAGLAHNELRMIHKMCMCWANVKATDYADAPYTARCVAEYVARTQATIAENDRLREALSRISLMTSCYYNENDYVVSIHGITKEALRVNT